MTGGSAAVGSGDRRDAGASTMRCFLVPDLEGEIVATTAPVEELLLTLAWWSEDDPDLNIPTALQRDAADAVGMIRSAIARTPTRSLYRPDGLYEHEPLAIVRVPEWTVASYGSAVSALGRAAGPSCDDDVAESLDLFNGPGGDRQEIVSRASRLLGLCEQAWGEDEALIARRLAEPGSTSDRVCLTGREEIAYSRIRDRLVAVWHDNSALSRWAY